MLFSCLSVVAALLALVEPSLQAPSVVNARASLQKPNLVTLVVVNVLTVYPIQINDYYRHNGVYSIDENYSLTVQNAPTSVSLLTSGVSTSHFSTITRYAVVNGLRGKTMTITSTSTIRVKASASPSTKQTSSSSLVPSSTPAATTSTSSASRSPTASTAAAVVPASSSTSSYTSSYTLSYTSSYTSSTSRTSSAPVSTATSSTGSILSSGRANCNVPTNGPTDIAWQNSIPYFVSTVAACASVCSQLGATCGAYSFNPNVTPNQPCTIFSEGVATPDWFNDVGATGGFFYLWDATC